MLRVRLGQFLRDEDLGSIGELAAGMTGADIERVVNDAKRAARHGNRSIAIADLRNALVQEDGRSPELKWRACVHEAGHITADVIRFGPYNI